MSYATMPTFEGNSLGVRYLGTLKGAGLSLSGLGDTQGDLDAAVAAGIISQNDADTLSILGVTDAQVIALLNGQTDYSSVMYQLATKSANASLPQPQPVSLFTGLSQPTSPGSSAAAGGINPAVAPAAPGTINYSIPGQASPAGSTLIYNASWSAGIVGAAVATAIVVGSGQALSALSALQNLLPGTQAKLISGNAISNGPMNYSISVTVQDTVGHAKITDLQGVLDAIVKQAVGVSTITSSLSMLSLGTGSLTPPPGAPQNLTQWFEANWGWLAAALGVIVIVPQVIKKL